MFTSIFFFFVVITLSCMTSVMIKFRELLPAAVFAVAMSGAVALAFGVLPTSPASTATICAALFLGASLRDVFIYYSEEK